MPATGEGNRKPPDPGNLRAGVTVKAFSPVIDCASLSKPATIN